MSDRLLWSRRQKLRDFALRLAGAMGPTILLALFILATGGGVTAIAVVALGTMIVLGVISDVRTPRGAFVGGVVIAIFLLALQIAIAWLVDHPILE